MPQHQIQPSYRFKSRSRPLVPDLLNMSPTEHSRLGDLMRLNRGEEKLVSWSHEQGSWVVLDWPNVCWANTMRPLAPSGFLSPKCQLVVCCPDTRPNGDPYAPLVATKRRRANQVIYVYEAKDHVCLFKVYIPDRHTRGPTIGRSSSPIQQFSSSPPLSVASGVSRFSSPARASSEILTPSSSSTGTLSIIAELRQHATLYPNARAAGLDSPIFSGAKRPQPRLFDGALKCYLSADLAEARKNNDNDVMNIALQFMLGDLPSQLSDTRNHLAYDPENPPQCLHPYEPRIYHRAQERGNNHTLLNTAIGAAIQDLNSPVGITFKVFDVVRRSSETCEGCGCEYSPDGYKQHVVEAQCTNDPALKEVKADVDSPTRDLLPQRTFRDGKTPQDLTPVRSPICSAFYEWNSRIGVPRDVWFTIQTAVICCIDCELVRSLPAHRAHLDVQGQCVDPKQELSVERGGTGPW
uniref:Uncharacterized protein n=1 Tax=Mycena chlorophos TaxID=658473 RepID=A0ABQ0KZD1_MYCCL|nr:predicted protein [Mycena chlorophos]